MRSTILLFLLLATLCGHAQTLYEMPVNAKSRLSSFENPNGVVGNGGRSNRTGKGNAWEWLKPGETKSLLNVNGEGTIRRIWMTIDQNPTKLRSIRLQMFWDGSSKPAVDVPLGDFFGYNLGKPVAFQSALFSSAEGRSFNCYITMPFRKSARIQLINDGKEVVKLYYDVDYLLEKLSPSALYFHSYWTRQMTSKLGDDFLILPKLNGRGRFLGMSVGLNTDSTLGKSWWGEGEFKVYLDGDKDLPTIVGTGAEDYIGSAWGLGTFTNLYQGCTIANDSTRQFNFYRLHIPDPIYFEREIKVTLQQIGGWGRDEFRELSKKGANVKAVTIDGTKGFLRLLEMNNPPAVTDEGFHEGWVNFYRVDDYSAVSYFYLNKPSSELPALPGLELRLANVK